MLLQLKSDAIRVRVHVCNHRRRWTRTGRTSAAVALALLLAVAGGGIGVALTVVTPIRGMALAPAPLGRRLIGPVVCVRLELLALPATPARALTRPLGAVALLGNVAPRLEQAAAGRTPPLSHGSPPGLNTSYQEIRRQSVN